MQMCVIWSGFPWHGGIFWAGSSRRATYFSQWFINIFIFIHIIIVISINSCQSTYPAFTSWSSLHHPHPMTIIIIHSPSSTPEPALFFQDLINLLRKERVVHHYFKSPSSPQFCSSSSPASPSPSSSPSSLKCFSKSEWSVKFVCVQPGIMLLLNAHA